MKINTAHSETALEQPEGMFDPVLSEYGTDYAFNSKYVNDFSNKDNNNYYFAYLLDHRVNIFPKVITKERACAIIKVGLTELNVFTYYGESASKIVGPYPIFHSAHDEGEYPHYHYGYYEGAVLKQMHSHALFMY